MHDGVIHYPYLSSPSINRFSIFKGGGGGRGGGGGGVSKGWGGMITTRLNHIIIVFQH